MAFQDYTADYSSTLASGYTAGGTTLSVNSASGLPPSGREFYLQVLAEGANTTEYFKVTSYTGTTLTVVGAQEGTSASNHASTATITGCWWLPVVIDGVRADLVQYGTDASLPATTDQKKGNLYIGSDSGKIYRFNGSTWDTLTGTGRVLLEEHTASSSSELDFTTCISSLFDEYEIELLEIKPATDNAKIQIQMGTGGGPTYDTGSNYAWQSFATVAGGSGPNGSGSDTSLILMAAVSSGGSTTAGGSLRLIRPASAVWKNILGSIMGWDSTNTRLIQYAFAGTYMSTTAVTAFRVLMSSGNFNGTIRVYGVLK